MRFKVGVQLTLAPAEWAKHRASSCLLLCEFPCHKGLQETTWFWPSKNPTARWIRAACLGSIVLL